MARPTKYTKKLSDQICERLAMGDSMRTVASDNLMPAMTTLFRWLREKDEFRKQYELAKIESADSMADSSLHIADHESAQPAYDEDGKALMVDGKPLMVVTAQSVAQARLRIDTRKWYASKLKPKKYGDKSDGVVVNNEMRTPIFINDSGTNSGD